ncbi:hypothetical protein FBY31_4610 [Arthrobacter sp. SLBN-100]|uniref:hypothetical protein n=1 Tax=Arthrobacter sp. SLBN-100 TaxID=2768450 RepID=UPI0011542240|nr:hypothetical protein [Arthrobacter sp. SLBN-100]TQJ62211.1 hypothetical protein FBY31_4610 [Arthrobacter sp. SLBN-100]
MMIPVTAIHPYLWAIFERPSDRVVRQNLRHCRPKELHHGSDAIKYTFPVLGLSWKNDWAASLLFPA